MLNNAIKFLLLLLFCCYSFFLKAQFSDLARADFTIIPKGNSNVEYNRLRGLFNYPIKLKKEGSYIFIGFDYSNINLIIDDNVRFDNNELDEFQLFDLVLSYTTPLKNDWRLAARFIPGVSSNLTANDLTLEDVILSGDVVFIKDKTKDSTVTKPTRLIIGISYAGNRGYDFPLPFISYYKKFKPKWSFNLGVPKSNLQYHISTKHRLKLYAELDGFTANMQNGIEIDSETNDVKVAKKINMSLIVGGLEYEYQFTKHLLFYARAAYILTNSVELRSNSNKKIISLDNSNVTYFRTGMRLKI